MSHKEFAEMYTSGSAASEYANNKINQIATDLLALLNSSNQNSESRNIESHPSSQNVKTHQPYLFSSKGSAFTSAVNKRNIAADLLTLVQGSSSASVGFLSEVEQALLRAVNPIEINETEELTVLGQRGIWLNRAEVSAWRGDTNIAEYLVNKDSNPKIITKKAEKEIDYVQELAIRYLRPPTPPAPGEIVITQKPNIPTGPAPPFIIRQVAPRGETPKPLVIREVPPERPKPIGVKRIVISGKRIPPPPRKVVIERLAALPPRPQNVIIERWLPYAEGGKRRVVFNKPIKPYSIPLNPRNVIVQWKAPEVVIRQKVKYSGVVNADPAEYVKKYGDSLKHAKQLPQFVHDIKTPDEYGLLAANHKRKSLIELEGQLDGFRYINLDKEGLGHYRSYLFSKGIHDLGAHVTESIVSQSETSVNKMAASQIFAMIDSDNSGSISLDEAQKIILRLNSRLKRSYGEIEVRDLFHGVGGGQNNITREQFLNIFTKL